MDIEEVGARQGGVVSRRQIYALGWTRSQVRAQLRARRWQKIGEQVIALHNSTLSDEGHRWAAVIASGPRGQLDAIASQVVAGLERFDYPVVRVSVPRGARVRWRRTPYYDIRQTRRWAATDRAPGSGIARTRPEVAAVRAALWARTDKEAAYVLTASVQQGVVAVADLAVQVLRVRRDKRRLLVHAVVNDLLDGARALGEIDFGRELKRRGFPAPQRQVLRKDRRGRYYLDLYWPELSLVVEVDGIHHAWAENVVGDALRQNSLALAGDVVLRIPLLGLRLQPDAFFDQIGEAITRAQATRAAA
ncbi:DUF559 domain-containing protein [Nocardioides maradonensis]